MDAAEEAGEEEAEDESAPRYHKLMMPELIVSLDADDEFLRERVMNLPESVVVGTHNTEDGLARRLAEFRAVNNDDDTVLNYFDELEFHPEHIGQSAVVLVSFLVKPASLNLYFSSNKGAYTLDIAPLRSESPPQKRSGMARVLKGFHSFTCTPTRSSAIGMSHICLCLPSYNWYSFTDPEGWKAE